MVFRDPGGSEASALSISPTRDGGTLNVSGSF
jgi:hypothetical protein